MLWLLVSWKEEHVSRDVLTEFPHTASFARAYKKDGMYGYVNNVQRQERAQNVDVLQHQKWSGANYVDNVMKIVTGGVAATAAMGKGVTEDQFKN